jgi:dienelactone hydrolase
MVEVISYEGAFHGWDRLEVPIKVEDPFSNRGLGGEVEIVPNATRAYEARNKVVRFFRDHL